MACFSREGPKYGYKDFRFEQNVDENFHCSICYNVLKEPRTCRNNDHLFCLECITQHLKMNSQTCPECNEHLSFDTLRRPRVVNNYLSKLKISCDYAIRGCPEFVCVEDLNTHVANCGFAPVLCSNENCGLEMNRHEKEYHETVLCEYRILKCHDWGQMKEINATIEKMQLKAQVHATNKKMEIINEQMGEIGGTLKELSGRVEAKNVELIQMKHIVGKLEGNFVGMLTNRQHDVETKIEKDVEEAKKEVKDVKDNLAKVNKDISEMEAMITQLLEKLNNFELLNKQPSPTETILNNPREDILIVGDYGGNGRVEIYSWEKGVWIEISRMNDKHRGGSSFIHNDQLFVVGGSDTKKIEFLVLKNFPLTWKKLPGELPYRCWGHQTVVCQQRVFYIGGYNLDKDEVSNAISELRLTSPFTMSQLCKMSVSRCHHGVEIIEDKILILGGQKSWTGGYLASVVEFDPKTNVCRNMPPLTQPLSYMATVSWRDQVVVLGGLDKHGKKSNNVFMYDCKTGKTTALPSMLKKRWGCCAVITGDTIAVMGGCDERHAVNSVEHFRMGSSTWEYLPAMNKEKYFAAAEVLPSARKYV